MCCCGRSAAEAEAGRQRLIEETRLLGRLERHRLADEPCGPRPRGQRLEAAAEALAERAGAITLTVTRRARDLGEREGLGVGARPFGGEQLLDPGGRGVAWHYAVERPGERHPRTQTRERPELRLARPSAHGLADEQVHR